VQCAGHQFLAGARFAVDHHGQIGRRQPRDRPVDLLHRRAAPDQWQAFLGIPRFRWRHDMLGRH